VLGNLFELRDLGAKDLKGIAAPARAWALRASSAESRFEALHASSLTALVGPHRADSRPTRPTIIRTAILKERGGDFFSRGIHESAET
jgi:hypothetical protein